MTQAEEVIMKIVPSGFGVREPRVVRTACETGLCERDARAAIADLVKRDVLERDRGRLQRRASTVRVGR